MTQNTSMAKTTSRNLQRRQRLLRGFWVGGAVALLVMVLSLGNLLNSTRLSLNNIYYLDQPTEDEIVIIAMDDASLAAYGRSPVEWDRGLYADLVGILNAGGARVIGFDVLFAEPTEADAELIAAIEAARNNPDGVRTRTVMPIAGAEPVDAADGAVVYRAALGAQPALAAVADYVAYVNTIPDVDASVRRAPSFITIGEDGETEIGFGLAVLLASRGVPAAFAPQMLVRDGDILRIMPEIRDDQNIQLDERGMWMFNYFGTAPETFPVYSLQAVLNGEVNPAEFDDKIVLIGLMNATGLVDQYQAPLSINGRNMAGVEIHANIIETLLQNRPLRPLNPLIQAVLLALLAIGSGVLFANFRWVWMLLIAGTMMIAFATLSFVLFDVNQMVIDLLDGLLALSLPALLTLGVNISTEIARRQRAEFLLTSLYQVSHQRLVPEKVLPRIAEDIQRVVGESAGTIWLFDENGKQLQNAYQWAAPTVSYTANYGLANRATITRVTVTEGHHFAIPILWQRRVLGAIYVELQDERQPKRDAMRLLNTLTEQAAPVIENALLYAQTQRQNRLLQGFLNGAPSPFLVLDADLVITDINPSFDYEFELHSDDFMGQPIGALLDGMQLDAEVRKSINEAFAHSEVFRQEIQYGGQVFYMDAALLKDIQRWVVVYANVSSLAELNELKTQMIRMASHDLKNPLGSVMGFAELLMEEDIDERHKRYVETIFKASDNMLGIITDILDMEQLRSGKTVKDTLDGKSLVNEVLTRHLADAENKGQTVTKDIADDVPLLDGDYRMLTQAFSNLIGNAIKYTPDGGKITVRFHTPDDEHVQFEVADNGYGIAKDAQDRLFTQFYRVRSPETAHIKGTGLGLSFVKSIVENHNGTIWLESEQGEGSTFFVKLPIHAEPQNV